MCHYAGVDCNVGEVCTRKPQPSDVPCPTGATCDVHTNWVYGEGMALKETMKRNLSCEAGSNLCVGKSGNSNVTYTLVIEAAAAALAVLVVNILWS